MQQVTDRLAVISALICVCGGSVGVWTDRLPDKCSNSDDYNCT